MTSKTLGAQYFSVFIIMLVSVPPVGGSWLVSQENSSRVVEFKKLPYEYLRESAHTRYEKRELSSGVFAGQLFLGFYNIFIE
jgi:hypothetical protein